VTSRAVLHIRSEHEFRVPPLALPDLTHLPESEVLLQYAAVALFLHCAQTARALNLVSRSWSARAVGMGAPMSKRLMRPKNAVWRLRYVRRFKHSIA